MSLPERGAVEFSESQLASRIFKVPSGRVISQRLLSPIIESSTQCTVSQTFIPKGPNNVYRYIVLEKVESQSGKKFRPWHSHISCSTPENMPYVVYTFTQHEAHRKREIEIYNPFRNSADDPVSKLTIGDAGLQGEFFPRPRNYGALFANFTSAEKAVDSLRWYVTPVLDNPDLFTEVRNYRSFSEVLLAAHYPDPESNTVRGELQKIRDSLTAVVSQAFAMDTSEESQGKQAQLISLLMSTGLPTKLLISSIDLQAGSEEVTKELCVRILNHIYEITEELRPSEFLIVEFEKGAMQIATAKLNQLPVGDGQKEEVLKATLPKRNVAYDTPIEIEGGYVYTFHRDGDRITAKLAKGTVPQHEITFTDTRAQDFDMLLGDPRADFGELLTRVAPVDYTSLGGSVATASLIS